MEGTSSLGMRTYRSSTTGTGHRQCCLHFCLKVSLAGTTAVSPVGCQLFYRRLLWENIIFWGPAHLQLCFPWKTRSKTILSAVVQYRGAMLSTSETTNKSLISRSQHATHALDHSLRAAGPANTDSRAFCFRRWHCLSSMCWFMLQSL